MAKATDKMQDLRAEAKKLDIKAPAGMTKATLANLINTANLPQSNVPRVQDSAPKEKKIAPPVTSTGTEKILSKLKEKFKGFNGSISGACILIERPDISTKTIIGEQGKAYTEKVPGTAKKLINLSQPYESIEKACASFYPSR